MWPTSPYVARHPENHLSRWFLKGREVCLTLGSTACSIIWSRGTVSLSHS